MALEFLSKVREKLEGNPETKRKAVERAQQLGLTNEQILQRRTEEKKYVLERERQLRRKKLEARYDQREKAAVAREQRTGGYGFMDSLYSMAPKSTKVRSGSKKAPRMSFMGGMGNMMSDAGRGFDMGFGEAGNMFGRPITKAQSPRRRRKSKTRKINRRRKSKTRKINRRRKR